MWGKYSSDKTGLIGVKSKAMKNIGNKSMKKIIRAVFWLKREN